MSEGEKKTYKWEVRKGGTVPADALNVKHATSTANQASNKESLLVEKGAGGSRYGEGAVEVAHATSVPDPTFNKREFQKSDANHAYGDGATAVTTALNAPKKPETINTVDVTERVTGNASGF